MVTGTVLKIDNGYAVHRHRIHIVKMRQNKIVMIRMHQLEVLVSVIQQSMVTVQVLSLDHTGLSKR